MKSKYIIDGIPLDVYCKKHNLNFKTQSNRVRSYIKNHPELSQEEAIKLAISRCGLHTCAKYIYNSISLSEWCRNNNKNYYSMVSRIESIQKSMPNITVEEATRIAIEDFNDKGTKYFYKGMPLVEYCLLNPEYSYNSIRTYIRRTKEKNTHLNYSEIINSYFEKDHATHTNHYVDDISLKEYCQSNNLDYYSIIHLLHRLRKDEKYRCLTEQERLEIAIKREITNTKKRNEANNLKEIFSYLKREQNIEEKLLKDILLYLKIDYENVLQVKEKFLNISQAVLFVWYFYDKTTNGLISASNEKINEIFLLMRNLPTNKNEIMVIDLYILIALYKSCLLDTRYLILVHQENFNYYTLLSILKSYELYLEDDEKREIIEDTNVNILRLLERNNINNIGMVISYVTKSTRLFILRKVKKLMNEKNNISLSSPVYKESHLKVIDTLSIKSNESIVDNKVKDFIETLDRESQEFIYYKYYEQLSDNEVACLLKKSLNELEIFEKNLLKQLSKEKDLKKLLRK